MAIAKSISGAGFIGAIGYALQTTKKKVPEHTKPILLEQNNCFGTASELAGQMRLVADGRRSIKKPVLHLVFALPPGETPTAEKAMTALESILADIGVQKDCNQYVVVQHRDKAHDHYHVVINRVGLDGSLIQDKFINNRLQVAASKVEQELGFAITPNRTFVYAPGQENGKDYIFQERLTPKSESALMDSNPVIQDDKQSLQRILNQVMSTVNDLSALQAALILQGITTKTKEVKGKVVGMSFKMPTESQLKGSEVGFPMSKINTIMANNLAREVTLNETNLKIKEAINKLRPQNTPDDVRAERIRAAIGNIRAADNTKQQIPDSQPIGSGPESTGADLASLNRNLRSDQDAAENQRALDAAARIAEDEHRLAVERAEAAEGDSIDEGDEPEPEMEKSRKPEPTAGRRPRL